jgi:hypothetical protein
MSHGAFSIKLNVSEQADFIFDRTRWSCHRGRLNGILADKEPGRLILGRTLVRLC